MTPFDHFEQLLTDFNRVEEPLFLKDVKEFAEKYPDVVTKTFSILLKNENLNIQLKYLVLKSLGEIKSPGLIPALRDTLKRENKVQIISEAINSLAALDSLPAYKVIIEFWQKHRDAEFKEKIERTLKMLFSKNHLVYHFDVFYRDRGNVGNLEKSSEFLIRHLPEEYIKDLLSAVGSHFHHIRYETLRILKSRPHSTFYSAIYYLFKEQAQKADDAFFLLMSEALVANASLSIARQKIFQKLKGHLQELKGNKRNVFNIVLLKLNTREILPHIMEMYPQLDFERKSMLLEYLNPDDYIHYRNFIRRLLRVEDNQSLLEKIVDILVRANEFKYLFEILESENGVRRLKLLGMILERDPREIHRYVKDYVTPAQDNQILYLSLEYLLRHAADKYFDLIKDIFFSGVSPGIKILVLHNTGKFDPNHQKLLMETIFDDLQVIRDFRKDFLFSLLGVMNEKVFDDELEEKILSRVLVLMEEAPEREIVNFIYFFDKYKIDNERDCQLIIDELCLIRNTLLKSASDQNLVRMIHVLIKNIERKMTLKKVKPPKE